RSRLKAHLQWLLSEKPTLRSLKTRLASIEPPQRSAIARFIVRVAAADGQINPQEVQLLEKVYTLLELDAQALYSDIHDLSTAAPRTPATEPVTVRKASSLRGHAIPPMTQKQAAVALDMTLVQSKLVESQEISNLLADIFVDEDSIAPGKAAKATQSRTQQTAEPAAKPPKRSRKKSADPAPAAREIAGLDAPHSALLQALVQQTVWQRPELEAIATSLNLMLDGALEVINDVAFDRQDEAVVEGHDSIEVNVDVLRELLS
ncbi:MAG TPA: tellurite resistance TerB C-terminal domain-containing protein, partial [Coleofasciculaceae cyanobacterium]